MQKQVWVQTKTKNRTRHSDFEATGDNLNGSRLGPQSTHDLCHSGEETLHNHKTNLFKTINIKPTLKIIHNTDFKKYSKKQDE